MAHPALMQIVACMVAGFVLSLWVWSEADRVHMRLHEVDLELAQSLNNSFLAWRDEGSDSRLGEHIKNELQRHPDAEVRRLALRVRRINRAAGALLLAAFATLFLLNVRAG